MNVEIKVPALDAYYEFELDEETELKVLAEEIAEVICQKEHCQLEGAADRLLLLHCERKRILSAEQTLIQAGVRTGDCLTLV